MLTSELNTWHFPSKTPSSSSSRSGTTVTGKAKGIILTPPSCHFSAPEKTLMSKPIPEASQCTRKESHETRLTVQAFFFKQLYLDNKPSAFSLEPSLMLSFDFPPTLHAHCLQKSRTTFPLFSANGSDGEPVHKLRLFERDGVWTRQTCWNKIFKNFY